MHCIRTSPTVDKQRGIVAVYGLNNKGHAIGFARLGAMGSWIRVRPCLSHGERPTSAAWSGEGVPLDHLPITTTITETDFGYTGQRVKKSRPILRRLNSNACGLPGFIHFPQGYQ